MNEKQSVFVICHTVFHNAFRSGNYRDSDSMKDFKIYLRSRFVLDVFIVIGAEGNRQDAFTSRKVMDKLERKLSEDYPPECASRYVKLLRSGVFVVESEKINSLDEHEGIFVIADTFSTRENYSTFILTSMKDGKAKRAKEYYKKWTGEDEPSIPFRILSLEESVAFLEGLYPNHCEDVRQRDHIYNALY